MEGTMTKPIAKVLLLVGLVLLLAGCAAGSDAYADDPAGFVAGFWHGLIAWPALIWSIFDSSVGIYEMNNSGFWYDLGFLLSATAITGGAGAGGTAAVRN